MLLERPISFTEFNLSKTIMKAVAEMGFEEATPIQASTIPPLLEGLDVIGQAQTGTGKTASFGIPLVQLINPSQKTIGGLVLTPTRELAIQVAEEITKIGKYSRLKVLPIYGGQSIEWQIRSLHRPTQIVVGTPGRIIDHINRGTIKLDDVQMVILDEADEMLNMGFIDDVKFILSRIPETRQTALFSATMPDPIRQLAVKYQKNPKWVRVTPHQVTVPEITQVYYDVFGRDKFDSLSRVLDAENPDLAIIFCRTKKGVDELTASLQSRGYLADGLHGDLSQAQRDRVMKKFREKSIEYLVATDVAARGLDVENVTHVINYDIPQDPEVYVHRIGRTGRAGKTGTAITFVTPAEQGMRRSIEALAKTKIRRMPLPTNADIVEARRAKLKEKIANSIAAQGLEPYRKMITEMMEEHDIVDIAAAATYLLNEGETLEAQDEPEVDFGDTGAQSGMVRFFINIGRADGIRPGDIVGAIAGEAELPGKVIGMINIYDKFTFVEVPQEHAARVLCSMQQNTIKGRTINIEPARKR